MLLFAPAFAAGAAPAAVREQDVEGIYRLRVLVDTDELRRTIYPRRPTKLTASGSDGVERTLTLPVEVYTEVRAYEPADDQAATSYERAYARLVASGDCQPLTAGFREASFDCGVDKGRRTIAVREDDRGTYFSWEQVLFGALPDEAAFDRARRTLDVMTESALQEAVASLRPQ